MVKLADNVWFINGVVIGFTKTKIGWAAFMKDGIQYFLIEVKEWATS